MKPDVQSSTTADRDPYKLRTRRGKTLRLDPHPNSIPISEVRKYARENNGSPFLVDLFSGAGGLSLGLQRAGFTPLAAADANEWAVETHRSHFPGVSVAQDISTEAAVEELLEPIRGKKIELLAGGPPCQPFSKAVRWKRAVLEEGLGSLGDHRRELWRSFTHAVKILQPNAVLMENVTDIATSEDGLILRSIFEVLEGLGYSFDSRTYFAHDFGVPQHRLRIFVVAFRDARTHFSWPEVSRKHRTTLRDAIGDLPPLEGGWDEVAPEYRGPSTEYQKLMRVGIADDDQFLLYDHVTRGVRGDDLEAFRLLRTDTRYDELPENLRRYSDRSFTDKYNRLSWTEPSRAITAHLARDGYWYIHPEQHRSVSIREAARIQSFPDWFRFAGFPTSAMRQIGEAVAPMVAEALGRSLKSFLEVERPRRGPRPKQQLQDKHQKVRSLLEAWYRDGAKENSMHPWRLEESLWLHLLGETIFSEPRLKRKAHLYWDNYHDAWPDPESYISDDGRKDRLKSLRVGESVEVLDRLAETLSSEDTPNIRSLTDIGIRERSARLALATSGHSDERPTHVSLVRVANRVFEHRHSRETDHVESQIATGMLIGIDEGAELFTAAIELGETICTKKSPACQALCPLKDDCAHNQR